MIEKSPCTLTAFPEGIAFKYPWRAYQQRVLDELQRHLTDRHLHVIAPPGSGKTVLGLEVALRLNQPTLVLAPTIAIRNQWIQRFCELFLQCLQPPDWISRDIRIPAFLTVVTYQGLHAACNNLRLQEENETEEEDEQEDHSPRRNGYQHLNAIVEGLKTQGVQTIVVDEAHHLKNEWWQTLSRVKEKLDPVVVGLTATPPYDVSATEWQRYSELNGPVDTEITVPELVIEGDLCPHQDYVYLSQPSAQERQTIQHFRQNIARLFDDLKGDDTLARALETHPAWQDPEKHLDWIYTNLPCFSATLIYLHACGREIPELQLEVIGNQKQRIPPLDHAWMETLLDFYLFKEKAHFKPYEAHQKSLENRLRRYGALERRQLSLSSNRRLTGMLSSSIGKLDAIQEIVNFEHRQLGSGLRLVILSDYIRREFYVNGPENGLELNKMGVLPIFEKLRRHNSRKMKIGVLTGSIILLPVSAYSAFQEKAARYGIGQLSVTEVPYDPDYLLINQTEQLRHNIVHIITQLFQRGELEVLIGTKSLLGEGWDAPAINSLILASFVGSFVLSNQMRGRAIRTQQGNPEKTSTIWHLACVDPSCPGGGEDMELLRRRFRSFVGISLKEEGGIENGIGRLNLPDQLHLTEVLERTNANTLAQAAGREALKQGWHTALATGMSLVEEIKIPYTGKRGYQKAKSLYYTRTIANLMAMLSSGALAYGLEALQVVGRNARHIRSLDQLLTILTIIGGIGVLIFGKLAYNAYRMHLFYRDISKDLQQIGQALLHTLIEAGCLQSDPHSLRVECSVDEWGSVYCHLEGGSTFEKSLFINTLQEVIGPIGNPRYVIVRRSTFMRLLQQKDYHSVPDVLGRKKHMAEYFQRQWSQLVGDCDLIFTRSLQGRKLLLKSRMASLAAQFQEEIEHISKWR